MTFDNYACYSSDSEWSQMFGLRLALAVQPPHAGPPQLPPVSSGSKPEQQSADTTTEWRTMVSWSSLARERAWWYEQDIPVRQIGTFGDRWWMYVPEALMWEYSTDGMDREHCYMRTNWNHSAPLSHRPFPYAI